MDNNHEKSELKQILKEINYCKNMMNSAICQYEKIRWINMATYKISEAVYKIEVITAVERDSYRQPQKEFSFKELSEYDGSMGKPAYVAVNGTVYDVSYNKHWAGGTHFALYAGKDFSKEFKECHNNDVEVLKILPVVGTLKNN